MNFINPTNNHTIEVGSGASMWCFIFGNLYFLAKGIWKHFFLLSILYAAVSGGITYAAVQSALRAPDQTSHPNITLITVITMFVINMVYMIFAEEIIRNHYLEKGWKEIEEANDASGQPS